VLADLASLHNAALTKIVAAEATYPLLGKYSKAIGTYQTISKLHKKLI
jgi:hypothetical protein